jgi:replicative DNA helicase
MSMDLLNHEAESLFLAGLLRHPDAYFSVNDIGIEPNDLLGQENRRVLKAIAAVVADKKVPELPNVLEELRGGDAALTIEYVQRLLAMPCSTAQAMEYAKTVKGLSVARQLTQAGASIIELAREHRSDADSAIAEAESLIRKVRDTLPAPERSPEPGDILRRIRQGGPKKFVPIRFSPTLQELSGGLQPGHLWVIGGYSSTGKSAVAVNFIVDVLRNRSAATVITPEMTQEQYMIRLLSAIAMVPQRAIRDRLPGDLESMNELRKAESALERSNLRIYDDVFRNADVRARAVREKETTGLDVLFVDYIQLIRGSAGDFAYQDTTEVILDLQQLAKDLSITVIAFSQVSNDQAKWDAEGNDSNVYSFKGSGTVKDAADLAVMLRRDRARQSPSLDFGVVKNRHGELKTIPMLMDLPTGRIIEDETGYEEDAA